MPPLPTEYQRQLDAEGLDWIRIRFWTNRGQVLDFTVQYETIIDDERVPVVRYDTAHQRPHRDRMFRNGHQEKKWLPPEMPYNEAMALAVDDINRNWKQYREAFHRGPA